MNQIVKFLAGLVLALLASSLFAANPSNGVYADDQVGMTQCLADAAAGKAVGYVPVTDSEFKDKAFVQKRIGKGGACLSGAYVHEDRSGGAPTGTVFVQEGFLYAEKVDSKGFTLYRMVKCSNPFRGIVVPTLAAAAAPATTSSVAVTSTTATPTATVAVGSATNAAAAAVVVNNNVNVGAAPAAASATCATPPCTPRRKTEPGEGGWCKVTNGKLGCNFEWRVLRTQDQLQNCGCQVRIPAFNKTPEQIVGFMYAEPGSKRCLQQKKIFADAIGVTYSDKLN